MTPTVGRVSGTQLAKLADVATAHGIERLRTRDLVRPGQRVIVGPFSDLGMDIGSVSDEWESPFVALCSICVPPAKRK